MSLLNKKYLISGCGLSFSGQKQRTWVNILKAAGLKIKDVSGPAVSNQWILNKSILEVFKNSYDTIIVQLTSLGKLDVEINEDRIKELVDTDTIRNFTYNGIWPSSLSNDHMSKQLYNTWLSSPSLETEDITGKLLLLNYFCKTNEINLYVYQGYDIQWSDEQKQLLSNIINFNTILYENYPNSPHYQFHDDSNSVPCLSYQYVLAKLIANQCCPEILERINKMFDKSANVVLT